LRILEAEDRPTVDILNWMMPDLDGISVCRRLGESIYSREESLHFLKKFINSAYGKPGTNYFIEYDTND
jgi:PleD family two-component response regulator